MTGAATNVTTVFWGTAWTSSTLLAQRIAFLEQQQAADGYQCREVDPISQQDDYTAGNCHYQQENLERS